MKTAMQELIDELEFKKNQLNKFPLVKPFFDGIFNAFIVMVQDKLPKEKEQIIDAYVKGFDISAEGWNGEYGIKDFNNIKEEIKAEELYNQTYNQNK